MIDKKILNIWIQELSRYVFQELNKKYSLNQR